MLQAGLSVRGSGLSYRIEFYLCVCVCVGVLYVSFVGTNLGFRPEDSLVCPRCLEVSLWG